MSLADRLFKEIHDAQPSHWTEADTAIKLLLTWNQTDYNNYPITVEYLQQKAGI